MKSLKDYINESVWDIEDNIESDNKEFVIDDVKKFIDDNYEHGLSQDCEFVFDEKLGKYIVNCKKTAWFMSGEEYLTNGMFKWGVVQSNFYCRELKNLKSLEGAPEKIDGNFDCTFCQNLESLEGAPKEVKGEFDCTGCPKLESLKGAPEEVGRFFACTRCENLKSLEGAPERVE